MKRMKRWGGLAVTLALLLGLAAVPGVQAEDEPIQITGLEQLDGIQSGSYQLAANLTIPENVILTVPSDVTITIDLNGHTVSKPTGTGRILENAGNVTINDSSTDKSGLVSAYRNNVGNTGTMVINGGTFETHCNVGGTTLYNGVGGTMTINGCVVNADFFAINNEGDMEINGGEFHSTSTNEPGTFAYCVRNYANMTINDATITGIQGALASASGVLKVYDGHFSTEWGNSRSFYALYIAGEQDVVTGYIYGGTYSSPKYAIYIGNDNKGGDGGINADATTFVYGGTYNGGISAIYRAQQTGNPYVFRRHLPQRRSPQRHPGSGRRRIYGGGLRLRCRHRQGVGSPYFLSRVRHGTGDSRGRRFDDAAGDGGGRGRRGQNRELFVR